MFNFFILGLVPNVWDPRGRTAGNRSNRHLHLIILSPVLFCQFLLFLPVSRNLQPVITASGYGLWVAGYGLRVIPIFIFLLKYVII